MCTVVCSVYGAGPRPRKVVLYIRFGRSKKEEELRSNIVSSSSSSSSSLYFLLSFGWQKENFV